jgi:phage gpG-like protein
MSFQTKVETFWNGTPVKIQGKKVVNKSAYEIGLVVERQAKNLCPVKTGRLAGSITTQSVEKGTNPESPATKADVIDKPFDENEVFVGTNVEYASDIEFGTGPHKITVKNAKVLTDGKTFFGKSVNHPGTPAQPFLRPALDLAKGEMLTIIEKNGRFYLQEYLQ